MNKKQIDRLLRLADFLRRLPPENFDMDAWNEFGVVSREPTCGTTACIGGWSTLFFPELSLRIDETWDDIKIICLSRRHHVTGADAIAEAWGMSVDDAERVCLSYSHDDPKEAADFLESVVNSNAEESGYEIVEE